MIRLTEIVKEIAFTQGHASSNRAEDISSDALYMSGIDDAILNSRKNDDDYNELEISVSDPVFQKQLKKLEGDLGDGSFT